MLIGQEMFSQYTFKEQSEPPGEIMSFDVSPVNYSDSEQKYPPNKCLTVSLENCIFYMSKEIKEKINLHVHITMSVANRQPYPLYTVFYLNRL